MPTHKLGNTPCQMPHRLPYHHLAHTAALAGWVLRPSHRARAGGPACHVRCSPRLMAPRLPASCAMLRPVQCCTPSCGVPKVTMHCAHLGRHGKSGSLSAYLMDLGTLRPPCKQHAERSMQHTARSTQQPRAPSACTCSCVFRGRWNRPRGGYKRQCQGRHNRVPASRRAGCMLLNGLRCPAVAPDLPAATARSPSPGHNQ